MDWGDETYVRLYTRDTVTWLNLPWQAQTVLALLLRKVDRAGFLDLSGRAPGKAIAAVTRLPMDVVAEGLPPLLEEGILTFTEQAIAYPNFIEAQETKSSDAQRQRDHRARRRDLAHRSEELQALSQNVTGVQDHNRHVGVTERDSTVTKRDGSERIPVENVTLRYATLSDQISLPASLPAKDLGARSQPVPPRGSGSEAGPGRAGERNPSTKRDPRRVMPVDAYRPGQTIRGYWEKLTLTDDEAGEALDELRRKMGSAAPGDQAFWDSRYRSFLDGRLRRRLGQLRGTNGAQAAQMYAARPPADAGSSNIDNSDGWYANLPREGKT